MMYTYMCIHDTMTDYIIFTVHKYERQQVPPKSGSLYKLLEGIHELAQHNVSFSHISSEALNSHMHVKFHINPKKSHDHAKLYAKQRI